MASSGDEPGDRNPYAPPGAAPPPGDAPEPDGPKKKKKKKRARYSARFEGNVLVLSRDAELPSVCLKCGTHDGILRRKHNFQWTPVWSRLLLVCGLIGIIVMSITRKHASLEVPLCSACNQRWTAARNAAIAGVVAIVLAVVFMRTRDDPRSALVVVGVAIAAFLGVLGLFVRPRMLQVDRIDATELHLKGFHTAAAQEIVDGAS